MDLRGIRCDRHRRGVAYWAGWWLTRRKRLSAGDGAAVSQEPEIRLIGIEQAEVLVFDLP